MHVLERDDIERLLDMPSCVRVVEDAFRRRGEGGAARSAMFGYPLDCGTLHTKIASIEAGRSYVVAKINANLPRNPVEHNLPTIQGVLVLFDGRVGTPLAVMDSATITAIRTAAATAVACERLARADATRVTFVGCGVQARAHLTALRHVRDIREVFAVDERPTSPVSSRSGRATPTI